MAGFDTWLFASTLAALLGCGLVAGVFFAFSTFVMRGLARIAPSEGIAAMQSINAAALRPPFLAAFLGSAVLCIVALVLAIVRWQELGSMLRIAGGALYLGGSLAVTIARNVPMNEALAALARADPRAEDAWRRYVVRWTAWNHVRTIASLAAAAAFAGALAC